MCAVHTGAIGAGSILGGLRISPERQEGRSRQPQGRCVLCRRRLQALPGVVSTLKVHPQVVHSSFSTADDADVAGV